MPRSTLCFVAWTLVLLPLRSDAVLDAAFKMVIMSSTERVSRPSTVVVRVTVANISDHEIRLILSSPFCDYQMDVTDESGRPVTRTVKCERVMGMYKVIRIEPKGTFAEDLEISEYRDFSKPGKYSVQLARKIPIWLGTGIVRSNKIMITVKP